MKKQYLILTLLIGFSLSANLNSKGSLTLANNKAELSSEKNESYAYGLARAKKMEDFYVQNERSYGAPQIVEKLPPSVPLSDGHVETIDEIPSSTGNDYYDGSKGLKITVSTCNAYTSKREVCLQQGSCGWCGSSNSCIEGNNLGPLAPCLRGSFFLADPNWIPENAKSISRSEVLGAQLTKVVVN